MCKDMKSDTGTRTFEFAVTLSAPSPTPVTVHYRTTGAFFAPSVRATGRTTKRSPTPRWTFAAYDTRKIVTVTVKGDTKVERNVVLAGALLRGRSHCGQPRGR
jgi:hypothetical protein